MDELKIQYAILGLSLVGFWRAKFKSERSFILERTSVERGSICSSLTHIYRIMRWQDRCTPIDQININGTESIDAIGM